MQKLTAVEWLFEQIPFEWSSSRAAYEKLQQAKQMEDEQQKITEDTSDGYHTFKILYEIRKAYNVALFNEWAISAKYNVHKSRKHYDGEYPFGREDWFIVCAELPSGQISNHYELKDWDLFKIPTKDKGLYPFDGHTTQDVINRLKNI
jgi:hypothetical protein